MGRERMSMLGKKKKSSSSRIAKGNRVLITINVLGSAGPMRLVVYEEELVAAVIDTALKSYSRAGRLPILGSDLNEFLLYCPAAGSDSVMSPWEEIGAYGGRNFMLCKKPQPTKNADAARAGEGSVSPTDGGESPGSLMVKKGSSAKWKAWINKSLSFKIASH